MNPIAMLLAGAAYGYLAGNPRARSVALNQLQKLSGATIDGLSRQGGDYVQKPDEETEEQD